MLKRGLSIVALLIFLTNFAGFYIYFIAQLRQVRQEMRAKLKELPPEKLDVLIFSPIEYEKANVEKNEIKVDGKMYDIARVEKKEGNVIVYCLHDEAEDNLLAFLDKILSLPLKDKHVPASILQFYVLPFIPVHWSFVLPKFAHSQPFTAYTKITAQYILALAAPPPKL